MHNWRGDSRGSLSVRVFLSGDNKSWQRQEQYIARRGFFKEEEIRRVDGACNSCARANHGRHDGSIIDKPNFFFDDWRGKKWRKLRMAKVYLRIVDGVGVSGRWDVAANERAMPGYTR